MEEHTAFTYHPLPPNHIRLMVLWGIPVNALPNKISCRFETHHIDDLPEYDAISHAWGVQAHTEEIECYSDTQGRGEILVSSHLWSGLGKIMHKASSSLCWLDILCINQNDQEEKEQQISLMAKIYSRATNVVIWLGDPEFFEDEGFLSPEALAAVLMVINMAGPGTALLMQSIGDVQWHVMLSAIRRMNLMPWFRRSWVCQEAILAQDLVVLYGLNRIPWDLLYELSTGMHHTNLEMLTMQMSDNSLDTIADTFNSLTSINELRGERRRARAPIKIDRLIQLIRCTSATKLCDKVYCILGLVDPKIAEKITVDYSKSYEQVYLEFAQAVITTDKRLSLLANTSSTDIIRSPSIPLPSWCPDLSRPAPDVFSFLDFEYFAGFENQDDQTNRVTLLPDQLSISVPGFRLGVVAEVAALRPDVGVPEESNMLSAMQETMSQLPTWMDSVDELIGRALKPLGKSAAEILDVTWRTHIADAANAYLRPDPDDSNSFLVDYGEAFYPACEFIGEGYSINRAIMENGYYAKLMSGDVGAITTFNDFMAEKGFGEREMKLFEAFGTEFRGFARRRIFRTQNGLVGIGPSAVEVGDVACVLYDASPIFLLRKIEGNGDAKGKECFRSVGDGFVYGCMELAKTPAEFKDKREDFVIG